MEFDRERNLRRDTEGGLRCYLQSVSRFDSRGDLQTGLRGDSLGGIQSTDLSAVPELAHASRQTTAARSIWWNLS